MLSFTEGLPIARIEGGKHHNKILKIKKIDSTRPEPTAEDLEFIGEVDEVINRRGRPKIYTGIDDEDSIEYQGNLTDYMSFDDIKKGYKKGSKHDINHLINALLEGKAPNGDLKKVFNNKMRYINEMKKYKFTLSDGKFTPMPYNLDRDGERIFVSGPSGAGKSTYVMEYAKNYKNMFPNGEFIVFSDIKQDTRIDTLKPTRPPLHDKKYAEEIIKNPLRAEELNDSLVLFDDCTTIYDKKLSKVVDGLMKSCLEKGRHDRVYTAVITHQMYDGAKITAMLKDMNQIIIFPKLTFPRMVSYFTSNYMGLTKEQIKKLNNLKTDWVCFSLRPPRYILTEYECFILEHF